jgi:hypothetical protein
MEPMGFGWSFYGFFVAAGVWLLLYFVWAAWMDYSARTDHRGDRERR